jgi:hypothetical protein
MDRVGVALDEDRESLLATPVGPHHAPDPQAQ